MAFNLHAFYATKLSKNKSVNNEEFIDIPVSEVKYMGKKFFIVGGGNKSKYISRVFSSGDSILILRKEKKR